MAERSYHHRKPRKKRAGWRWFWFSLGLIVLAIAGFIIWDIIRTQSQPQSGEVLVSEFTIPEPPVQTINEPTFSFDLPADWVEIYRFNEEDAVGVTWESRSDTRQSRQLTIYVDVIPENFAINRLLPIESVGRSLRHGQISDNCVKYTSSANLNAKDADRSKPVKARWEEVDFICDLPKLYDNVVGTGSSDGLNKVLIEGPEKGEHTYFFKYTDHSIHPNHEILLDVIESFRAR